MLKQLLSLVAVALTLVAATSVDPAAPIIALTHAIVDAANTNSAAGLAGIYTDDAVVVGENAPFVWRGAHAGTQWFNGVQRARNHAIMHAFADAPLEVQMEGAGEDAYILQRLEVGVTTNGKMRTEFGFQTYTFHKAKDGRWRISRQVWTTSASKPVTSIPPGTDRTPSLMMEAFSRHAPDAMTGLYTDDATVVYDIPPFGWDGLNAGAQWYAKLMEYFTPNAVADWHGELKAPVEALRQGDAAYLVVPVIRYSTMNGRALTLYGTYTFTLRNVGGNWLITSQTWVPYWT